LREYQEAWEAAGGLPRDVRDQLEGAFRKIEDSVRRAEEAEWERTNPEARARAQNTVEQLSSAIANLETKLEKARAKGDERKIEDPGDALPARRSWLTDAERALDEMS